MAQQFDVISPIDGRVALSVAESSPALIARCLDKAQAAAVSWRQTPLEERLDIVGAFIQEIQRREAEIAETITLCMGRPSRFAAGEVRGTVERATAMAAIAPEALADVVPPPKAGFLRSVKRVPHGTVFVMSPWNYPYLTAVNAVIPAILSGNSVILKPSDQTPLSGEHFREAFSAAGLPDGVFHVLHMTHERAAHVLADDAIDHVAFTGSVEGGAAVTRALAGRAGNKRFIGAGLELGGNDPAYVRVDADLDHAATNVMEGALFNSGQSCCGVERVYVDQDVFEEFVAKATAEANGYILGDPRDSETTLGPVVRQSNADSIRRSITDALDAGALAHVDAASFPADRSDSAYIAPQILTNVDHSMRFVSEETFGPCVGIMSVANEQEAIKRMNDSAFGLTASIWTKDGVAAQRIGEQIDAGTVFQNRCDYLDPYLSWTGVKNSGRGTTLSRIGFEQMTRPKSFHFRTEV